MSESHLLPVTLPIAVVERETGIAKETLRVWERRYGFPLPHRDAHGERLYPADQVDRLRQVSRLMARGMRPGKLLGASVEELAAWLAESGVAPVVPAVQSSGTSNAIAELLALLGSYRAVELRRRLQQMLIQVGLQHFVIDILAPTTRAVGDLWSRGELSLTGEHLYTEQVQNVLRAAIGTQMVTDGRPRVLFTTLPGEQHVLGLLMAKALLATGGASCVSLGTQTPLADLASATLAGGFEVVALSFSGAFPARQATIGLTELRGVLPGTVAVWAGGRGMAACQRLPDGIRVIRDIGDTIQALADWRAAHSGSSN